MRQGLSLLQSSLHSAAVIISTACAMTVNSYLSVLSTSDKSYHHCHTLAPAYAGAGYQHALGQKAYVKVGYRNVFTPGDNLNFAGVGVGFRF